MFGEIGNSKATRVVALSAMAVGIGAGSYGVASAASGDGSTSAVTAATVPTSSQALTAASGAAAGNSGNPWGAQRSDEMLLTGDTAAKVEAAAVAKAGSGATVVRV